MISTAEQERLAGELGAAGTPAGRHAVVARYAGLWGLSEQTIYRHAKRGGWKSGRTGRGDDGTMKTAGLKVEHYEFVLSYLTDKRRRRKKPPIAKAILDCERAAQIPRGAMTPTKFGRWAAERNIDWRGDWSPTRMRDTHVNLAAPEPNAVHQVDASVYAGWYVAERGAIDVTGSEKTNYKNKPHDGKVRVIRWIVCDMTTHAFSVRYTSDERPASLAEVLYHAWQRKDQYDVLPFCGVPKKIYWDLHGTHWSAEIQHLLRALHVEPIPTRRHQPRSHGAVESLQHLWERWFEVDQILDPPGTIPELQERADAMCAYLNSERRHSRYGRTRSDAWHSWMAAHPEALRLPVPWKLFRRLVQRSDERLVRGDGMISYDGKKYRLPREFWAAQAGKRVRINISPFAEGWIDVVCADKLVSIPAIEFDEWGKPVDANVIGGRIAASPATPRELAVREIRGTTDTTDVARRARMSAGDAGVSARFDSITPLFRPAVEDALERTYDEVDARARILSKFDRLSPVQRAYLAEIHGTRTESEIADEVEKMRGMAG